MNRFLQESIYMVVRNRDYFFGALIFLLIILVIYVVYNMYDDLRKKKAIRLPNFKCLNSVYHQRQEKTARQQSKQEENGQKRNTKLQEDKKLIEQGGKSVYEEGLGL